jgi:hypothetical protein
VCLKKILAHNGTIQFSTGTEKEKYSESSLKKCRVHFEQNLSHDWSGTVSSMAPAAIATFQG